MQYVPYHFVPVESKQGPFDFFCIARWRMDVQKDPPNLKKECSKRLGTCSMISELMENEWSIFNKNTNYKRGCFPSCGCTQNGGLSCQYDFQHKMTVNA